MIKDTKKNSFSLGDLTDTNSINSRYKKISPNEIYNFAAQAM